MVPVSSFIFCLISLLVSVVLPIAVLIILCVKNKQQSIASAWFLGAAGFFVTQICIRLPILTVLQNQSWFSGFANSHLFLYAFTLAFTAGLFELAGRFVVAKLLRKNLTCKRALAAGLGHGGIEAMILIGTAYINNLVYIVMINSGYFDSLITQTAGLGIDISQLELIRSQLISTAPGLFLLGGFERVLVMTAHTAMSMVVCYGVAHKKALPCLLVCLGIHTFIDLTAGISLALPQPAAYPIIYAILIVVAAVSLILIRALFRRWTQMEVSHDSEK